ncbi:PREDICTED: sorting nexin-6-like [Amphimedon queenslandica]|uniref:Sorting nexin n=1 Tax=Amphimedon queenslandica TaxID=400682 RepID=A0A1X7TMD9_AMPQE|nr:PREDICTED: sorting nexin-6-like [Amphimedon queenslandica]|eukprot:XP_019858797.1 PREDICTED: sorting nexin-6-like [Amphimedon queenslandica]
MASEGDASPETPPSKPKSVSVDLTKDTSLQIDISDALSEQEKVKFTVHTKTTLKAFKKADFSVVRQHEEFIWLHDQYVENETFAGYLIPPAPPKPDFDEPRQKLSKLREGEDTMTKEEYTKMKQELEGEYLALFKKTVAMHEVFLQRLAAHPVFRDDYNFQTFLEFDGELTVRSKNTRERFGSMFKGISKSVDEGIILKNHKDVDPWFEGEKKFLTDYHTQVKESTKQSDRTTKAHKRLADSLIGVASYISLLPITKDDPLSGMYKKTSETFEKLRKLESRVSTDEDLKFSDILRYYERDSQAGLDLLYRRMRSLANLEGSNKALEKARTKNKGVIEAEAVQKNNTEKFEKLSENGKQELTSFKGRRVAAFRKNLIDLTELQLKHAKNQVNILRATIASLAVL